MTFCPSSTVVFSRPEMAYYLWLNSFVPVGAFSAWPFESQCKHEKLVVLFDVVNCAFHQYLVVNISATIQFNCLHPVEFKGAEHRAANIALLLLYVL